MEKLELLKNKIASYGKLCVAYSGGVDSSFLLHVAYQVLGDNAMAVLVDSPVLARRDKTKAVEILVKMGVSYEVVVDDPFHISEFTQNSTMRCYFCKKNDFSQIMEVAKKKGIEPIADGQNADDTVNDHRPGIKAARELGVVSPLAECGLTKQDIRRYSKELGVSTWDKPSNACLASRFPYGFEITQERLAVIEAAEEVLRRRGMEGCRVRWHDNIARIEAPEHYFGTILEMKDIIKELKCLGFKYVTLDLEGFRSGSMN
ncbi:ATP-dependent sacrificial sulfur transferase LarE [uncultured Bacteroides sp.]|uniref:ATP-dependent sacrificial sulfur transferase LarE n=1 Tax=uncultured Bacteroides sp. TaxID=162156 RepID=UPI002AA712EC|nr:ATP-dependent sacrificial sulfur transferase LarE [uncultured Bacteroides sp.]